MHLRVDREFKSLKPGAIELVELPMFSIITGVNGAGKSHLLEGMQQSAVVFDDFGALGVEEVKYFGLGQLTAAAQGGANPAAFREPWAQLHTQWQALRSQRQQPGQPAMSEAEQETWIQDQIVSGRQLTREALQRMLEAAGKTLWEFSLEDFREHAPLVIGQRDPFATSIAEAFLTYSQRHMRNTIAQWRLETKGIGHALTDEEFVARYGETPWSVFDQTLQIVGLLYKVVPPVEDTDTTYTVELKSDDGRLASLDDLSSGERTLLAIAMSLFASTRFSESIRIPKVLLLDEADSNLHPSMVKSLLTVIEEIFVRQYNVRVLLATHSPSTVAMAPEDALFAMSSHVPRLRKVSADEALKDLTVGMSTLSVRVENRRQVFVESEYDQAVYQELYSILRAELATERSLEFISVGKKQSGGGADMVKRLVRELREAGNTTVVGLVDRDFKQGTPPDVHCVTDRHSMENIALDPLLLCAFLIREGVARSEDLGLPAGLRNFQLESVHAPALVDALAARLGFVGPNEECKYAGDFAVPVAREFRETRGHDLQDLILRVFPALNKHVPNLARIIVTEAAADVPAFIPSSVIDLFNTLGRD